MLSNEELNWSTLFDRLKFEEGLRSDAQLGVALGVSRSFICAIRKGRRGMPVERGELVLEKLKMKLAKEKRVKLFLSWKARLL